MNRNDDLRLLRILERIRQGNKPKEKDIDFVYCCMQQIAALDLSKIRIDRMPLYISIAGKIYLFSIVYERGKYNVD